MAKKTSSGWLVLNHAEDGSEVVYSGPDRKRAREKAEKALRDGASGLEVMRVTRSVKLSAASLVSQLPRAAF